MLFRQVELTFAVIVAGVTGDHLHRSSETPWELGRFIYTETLAGLAIFCSIIWLFPFASTFMHWPLDILISVGWFVSFGLLVDVSVFEFLFPVERIPELTRACSTLTATVVLLSTGTISHSARISVGNLKQISLSHSYLPFFGSSLALLASRGLIVMRF